MVSRCESEGRRPDSRRRPSSIASRIAGYQRELARFGSSDDGAPIDRYPDVRFELARVGMMPGAIVKNGVHAARSHQALNDEALFNAHRPPRNAVGGSFHGPHDVLG